MFNKIVDACRYLLKHFPEAQACREYLDSRISSDSQEIFQFGYFPAIENIQALIDLVGEDLLRTKELIYAKPIEDAMGPRICYTGYFDNNPIILPFRNAYGEAVGLVGRTLQTKEEMEKTGVVKYKNTKGTEDFKKSNLLFGLFENKQNILDQNCVYVVEGQFDVIKATECGYNNVVGLGTSSMSSYQFSVISRYTNNIFLLLDSDEAGERGRKSIVRTFGKYANIQNFYLPGSYKDIDECLTQNGGSPIPFIVKS